MAAHNAIWSAVEAKWKNHTASEKHWAIVGWVRGTAEGRLFTYLCIFTVPSAAGINQNRSECQNIFISFVFIYLNVLQR